MMINRPRGWLNWLQFLHSSIPRKWVARCVLAITQLKACNLILQEKTNYKSILYKTYFVMEYAVANYDVQFVLKTDDDAFINIHPLIQQLKLLCQDEGCHNERIYMVHDLLSC